MFLLELEDSHDFLVVWRPSFPPYDVNIGALNPGDLMPSKPTSSRLTFPITAGVTEAAFSGKKKHKKQ